MASMFGRFLHLGTCWNDDLCSKGVPHVHHVQRYVPIGVHHGIGPLRVLQDMLELRIGQRLSQRIL